MLTLICCKNFKRNDKFLNALIIGGAGFVGKYLIRHIKSDKLWNVYVTKLEHENIYECVDGLFDLNILNKDEIKHVLNEVKPDYIFHLAAQSSVALSWKNPGLTIDINVKGTVNLLEAVKEAGIKTRILLIGSGEEYGRIMPNEVPIAEDNSLRPGNIYAATKAAQNMIGKIYSDAYDMDIVLVRAFNHIGPEQAPMFVVADFCKQAVEIKKGLREPIIRVGNLSAKRDFTDVRDVVKAYVLLIENGKKGETYNVGSGKAVEINYILNKIIALSGIKAEVLVEKERLRPVDIPTIEADISKINRDTAWHKEIELEETLKDTINYWENNL